VAAYVQDVVTWTTAAGNKTATITPAVGGYLVVACANSGNTVDPTVTDNQGGTYSKAIGFVRSGSASAGWIYVRDQRVASAVAHIVTFAPGGADTGGGLDVIEFSGITRAGSGGVKQTAKQDGQLSGTTPAPVFGAAVNTNNPTVGLVGLILNPGALTPPTSWTERQDVGYATPASGLETVTRGSGFTGTTVTWGAAAGADYGDCIVELDASPASGPWNIPAITPPGPLLLAPTMGPPILAHQIDGVPAITAVVPVGQAIEVTIAQPIGKAKTKAATQAIEVDAAQTVRPVRIKPVVQAIEVDAAQLVAKLKRKVLGQAVEVDVGQAIARLKRKTLTQAIEIDSAQTVARLKSRLAVQAIEIDTALGIGRLKRRTAAQAVEVDVAQTIGVRSPNVAVTQAVEVDLAQAITHLKRKALAQALETDVVQLIGRAKLRATVQAIEIDMGQAVGRVKVRVVVQAMELDAAQTIVALVASTFRGDLAFGRPLLKWFMGQPEVKWILGRAARRWDQDEPEEKWTFGDPSVKWSQGPGED
jgi:hypothetical protein